MTSQTVLFVEDMSICSEPIAAVLRRRGYRVICVSKGREALKALEEHSPDLIMLDLALPDMSGLDLLKEIRASPQWEDLPAVVFTGSGDVSQLVSGLRVSACLIKSLASTAEIKGAIQRALAGK